MIRDTCLLLASFCCFFYSVAPVQAGIVIAGSGLSGGARWDAAEVTLFGNERSLAGGLRYSVSGGSAQALRDAFHWVEVPSLADFEAAITQSFAAWMAPDPVSQLTTALKFVQDYATPVQHGGFGTVNQNGAEIDIVASDAGFAGLGGFTAMTFFGAEVTLTSGVSNYSGSLAIAGVDLHINNNVGSLYTLDSFRRILTHELGHAIGLEDVDLGGGEFIDDNYDPLNSVATLNNSWTHLVNPLDPANSQGLGIYTVPPTEFTRPGVDLLMESRGLGVGPSNPLGNPFPLTSDEYGMRQFLYPTLMAVPEPTAGWLSLLGLGGIALRHRHRR